MKAKNVILIFFPFILTSCFLQVQNRELNKAISYQEAGDYQKSLEFYTRVVQRSPKSKTALRASRKAALIADIEINDFYKAINFYRHIIMYSKDEQERKVSQEKIALLYFSKLADYQNAVKEFQKLVVLEENRKKKFSYRFAIAKAYFYLNDFFQAETELDQILNLKLSSKNKFQTLLFKGNVKMNSKAPKEAIDLYSKVVKDFPDFSKKESVKMNLAVAFEEDLQFKKAIEVLKELKPDYNDPQFIDSKILRLQQRAENMPGAKGLRR